MDGRKELAIVLPPTSHDLSPSIPEQHHPAFAALPPAPSSAAVGILPLPPPPPSTLPTSPSQTISPQQLGLQHHQQQQQQQSGHHPAALVAAGTSPAQPSPLPQPSQMASFVQSSLHWVYNISTPETFDSNGLPRNRRKRRRTTDEEHAALEAAYRLDPQMPPAEREKLARTLNMPSKSVQIWFQNRRQTAKKNQDGTWNGIGKWQRTPYKVVGNYKVVGPEHVATQSPMKNADPIDHAGVVDAVHALIGLSQGTQDETKPSPSPDEQPPDDEKEVASKEAALQEDSAAKAITTQANAEKGKEPVQKQSPPQKKATPITPMSDSDNRQRQAASPAEAKSQPETAASLATASPSVSATVKNTTATPDVGAIPSLDAILAESVDVGDEDEGEDHEHRENALLMATTPPLVPIAIHPIESDQLVHPLLDGHLVAVPSAISRSAVGNMSYTAVPPRFANTTSTLSNISSSQASEFFNFSGYAADVEAATAGLLDTVGSHQQAITPQQEDTKGPTNI
ncbi:hypothetical protein PhCBS80983_g05905 [Powellomyces hirtus]|uniref:Homeobox domain-containing protein n=1 Tax=Powellomyces hirtus TaxID=109895 RepID=A0A507DRZ5_9FUNG|nr:hypothetical protein PhCBS80983_g05905 [Powellomyces hirtus]